MSSNIIQFRNCRLVRNNALITEDLWVRDGHIINPESVFFDEKICAHQQVDCAGAIIAPGFIDIQINGGYGIDFANNSDAVDEGVTKVAKGILAHGVTSFCPTVVTSSSETYHKVLPKIQRTDGGEHGANILGLHLEGPFISAEKKGAHQLHHIQELSQGLMTLKQTYGSLDNVAIITLAPEKHRSLEVIQQLTDSGITVAIGHSMSSLHQGELAIAHGSNLITHLFNAMLPFHHRDPGLVGLLSSTNIPPERTVYYGIISDGVHTHPAALRIAYRTHKNGLILVTDAISAMGLEDGTHFIGQLAIDVRCGQAYISGTNTLCGSIAPMDECIRTFKEATDCSIVFAVEAASLHPAKCLNIASRKGTLNFGADADFVMLGNDLRVWSTWIAGKCVYRA